MEERLLIDNDSVKTMNHTHRTWLYEPIKTDPVELLKYKRNAGLTAVQVWPRKSPTGEIELEDCLQFMADEPCTITFTIRAGINPNIKYYRDDYYDWMTFTSNAPLTFGGDYGTLYVYGKQYEGLSVQVKPLNSTLFSVKGPLYALCNWEDPWSWERTFETTTLFKGMFEGVTTLIDASGLSLWNNVYYDNLYESMFKGCTALKYAPTKWTAGVKYAYACCKEMFKDCTSLEKGMEVTGGFGGEESACSMYENCISLIDDRNLIGNTGWNCETANYKRMFFNCTSLKKAPVGTTLTNAFGGDYGFESCFENCTSLEEAWWPNGTMRYGYYRMYANCTGLTTIGGTLDPTTIDVAYAFKEMFINCTSLQGIVRLYPTMGTERGLYQRMFVGCTSLEGAVIMAPAVQVTPAQDEFAECFKGCSAFHQLVILQYENLDTAAVRNSFANWLVGVSETGQCKCSKDCGFATKQAGGTFIPLGWTLQWL